MTLKRIRKNVARQLFNADKEIILVGDNVAEFHFFGGWHLAIPIQKSKHQDLIGNDFDVIVNNFESHMEREIGRRAVYYVRVRGNR